MRNTVVVEEIAEDPTRYLVLGPNAAGLLELIVMDRPQGPVIHAMPLRPKYRHLLPESP